MAQLPMPDLPEGDLRDLIAELHSLHARAGWPSVREMARGQSFSYNVVHELFTQPRNDPPSLPVLLAVVSALANMDIRSDSERVLDKFDKLWQAVRANRFVEARSRLTSRERTVMTLLGKGASNHAIAQELTMSIGTAAAYIRRVYEKLGVSSKNELLAAISAFEASADDPLR